MGGDAQDGLAPPAPVGAAGVGVGVWTTPSLALCPSPASFFPTGLAGGGKGPLALAPPSSPVTCFPLICSGVQVGVPNIWGTRGAVSSHVGRQHLGGPGLWLFLCQITALVTRAMLPPHPVTATVAPGGFPGPPALLASHCSCSVLQPKGLTPRAPLPPTGSRGASQLCPLSPTRALTCSHAHIPAATLPCWHPWHAAVPSPSHAQEHVHPHALGLSHTLTHPHTPTHTHGAAQATAQPARLPGEVTSGGCHGGSSHPGSRQHSWALPLPGWHSVAAPTPSGGRGAAGCTGYSVLVWWLLNYWLI